jgi:hypothetical protein
MSNGAWKLSLAFLAVLALVEIGVLVGHSPDLLGPAESGSLHTQLHPEGILRFRRFVIDQFDRESPLSKAGAQIGDSIELDSAINLSGTIHAGETVGLTLFHGASSRHLALQSAPYNAPSDGGFEWLGVVYSIVGLAFALIIGFKRPESISCRALSFFFVMTVFDVFQDSSAPGFYYLVANGAWALTLWLFWGSLVVFAIYYPDDQPEGLGFDARQLGRGCLFLRTSSGTLALGLADRRPQCLFRTHLCGIALPCLQFWLRYQPCADLQRH